MKAKCHSNPWSSFLTAVLILGPLAGCGESTEAGSVKNVCGNGIIETGELCDGLAFPSGSASCQDMGFTGGELSCNQSCTIVDTTGCEADSADPSDTSDPSDTPEPSDASDSSSTSDPADPSSVAICGDDIIQAGETCDGLDLDGAGCETLGFESGALLCLNDCSGFDTSGCSELSGSCGDGVLDEGELCDGDDFGGVTCETVGYLGGVLGCQPDCMAYVLDACEAESACGNSVIDDGEVCDGPLLTGQSCASLGYLSGSLACADDCSAFDETQCWTEPPAVEEICGDGEITGYEACDGTLLGLNSDGTLRSCNNFFGQNLGSGALGCTDDCTLDLTGCGEDLCEAFGFYDNDACDRCDVFGGSADTECNLCSAADGICMDYYDGALGLWTCRSLGTPDPDCTCGNGTVEGGEFCDGDEFTTDWQSRDCSLLGGATGTLGCAEDCRLDLSSCFYDVVPVCGDGVLQGDEVCDVDTLGETTCESLGLPSLGPLRCASDCTGFDMAGCYGTISLGGACGEPTMGTCDDSLECIGFGADSYCVSSCDAAADVTTCADGFECVEFVDNNYCLQRTVSRDDTCYENGRSCLEEAVECLPTAYDYDAQVASAYRCKVPCDLGGDGSDCSASEACLADPLGFGSIQTGSPDCEDNTGCELGYECTELASGANKCFKPNGLCGDVVPPCLSSNPADWTGCLADSANHCSLEDGHSYCAEPTPLADGVDPAFALCVDAGGGTGLCFQFCERPDGTELDCGAGAVCERPDDIVLYLDVALDAGGNYAPCSVEADCQPFNSADDSSYACVALTIGDYCARPLKQCVSVSSGN
ncbi:MAG: hypothetical protein HOK28_11390 [Deltaproteobacteria bacterium]|nr:hypothetical protein [Deltaproteobacteria bacterium]